MSFQEMGGKTLTLQRLVACSQKKKSLGGKNLGSCAIRCEAPRLDTLASASWHAILCILALYSWKLPDWTHLCWHPILCILALYSWKLPDSGHTSASMPPFVFTTEPKEKETLYKWLQNSCTQDTPTRTGCTASLKPGTKLVANLKHASSSHRCCLGPSWDLLCHMYAGVNPGRL